MAVENPITTSEMFENLIGRVEAEIGALNQQIGRLAEQGEYEHVRELAQRAKSLSEVRDRAADLSNEWLNAVDEVEVYIDEVIGDSAEDLIWLIEPDA